MKKDFLSIYDTSFSELNQLLDLAAKMKKSPQEYFEALKAKVLVMIFDKPSTRTIVSFEAGMAQLGGQAVLLPKSSTKNREPVKDIARTVSRYADGIMIRTFSHKLVEEYASYATVPVINGLTDYAHPCQALGDIMTIKEKFGTLKGLTLAYVGDGFNVAHSLMLACVTVGINVVMVTPEGYDPSSSSVLHAQERAKESGATLILRQEIDEAIKGVDIVYTDSWINMGQEDEEEERMEAFEGFQVNQDLIDYIGSNPFIMHCLPAHRGMEITDEVIESEKSIVFDQAENRLHAQKAIMYTLMKD